MTYQDVNYILKILLQAEIALAKFLWVLIQDQDTSLLQAGG